MKSLFMHTTPALPRFDTPARPAVSPMRQLIAWIVNILLIGGVILVSVQPMIAVEAPVFFLFLTGHLCLTVHATRTRDMPTLALNAMLAALDVYAIAIRL